MKSKQLDFILFLSTVLYHLWQCVATMCLVSLESNWIEEHVDPPQQQLYLFLWNSRGRQFNSNPQAGGGRLAVTEIKQIDSKRG